MKSKCTVRLKKHGFSEHLLILFSYQYLYLNVGKTSPNFLMVVDYLLAQLSVSYCMINLMIILS